MIWYFVRHGETEWNSRRLFQGASDVPLNDTGKQQALDAGERLRSHGISFDKVYSSPLGRAVETAMNISGFAQADIILDERIREMTFGELEGTDYDAVKQSHAPLFKDPEHYEPEMGIESYDSLMSRTRSFIEDLKAEGDGDGRILIQSHGACLRALLTNLRGTALADLWSISVGNCEFFGFEYRDGQIREMDVSDVNGIASCNKV